MHHQKRRKKRQTHGVKTVEIARGRNGYGFTISGQQPCILSCIVAGSPAERAGLKPGDLLLAVNGENISKSPHDDAVRLIGSSSGVLVLQIAESNNSSDSSDDDYHYIQKPRSKYPSRTRSRNQNIYRAEKVVADLQAGVIFHDRPSQGVAPLRRTGSPAAFTVDSSIHTQLPDDVATPPAPQRNRNSSRTNQRHEPSPVPSRQSPAASFHEVIHVFGPPDVDVASNEAAALNTIGLRRGGEFVQSLPNLVSSCMKPISNARSSAGNLELLATSTTNSTPLERFIVGYVGSIEIPVDVGRPNSQILTIKNAVRRLRVEQSRIHTLVLLEVYDDRIKLLNALGTTMAVYPTDKLAFGAVCPDDKKFFGLITRQQQQPSRSEDTPNSSSCHIFMIDIELESHTIHAERALTFAIRCTRSIDQERCQEFPRSASPVVRAIVNALNIDGGATSAAGSNLANRSFSNSSTNSDSGLGFGREEIHRNNQVYIVDSQLNPAAATRSVNYRLMREARTSSPVQLRPAFHAQQRSLDSESQSESVSSAFISSRPDKTSSPVTVGEYDQTSDGFKVPRIPDTTRSRFNASNSSSPRDQLDQQNSADNLRRNTQKLMSVRHRYSTDVHSGSSDADSVRSENPMTPRFHAVDRRPVSIPNDTTFSRTPSRSGQQRETDSSSAGQGAGGAVLASKLSPRAITPKTDTADRIKYEVDLPDKKSLHNRQVSGCSDDTNQRVVLRNLNQTLSPPNQINRRANISLSHSHESLVSPDLRDQSGGNLNKSRLVPVGSLDVLENQNDLETSTNNASGSAGRAAGWAVSLHRLLDDRSGLDAFTSFLKKEFSEENIVFWTACENYKKIEKLDERKTLATEIFDKHLAVRSTEPVNIDSHARKITEENLHKSHIDLFNEAQRQIFQLMKHDSYVRFLKSDIYKQCVIADLEGLPLPYPQQTTAQTESSRPQSSHETNKKKSKKIKNTSGSGGSGGSVDDGGGAHEEKRRKSFLPWHKGKSKKDALKKSMKVKDHEKTEKKGETGKTLPSKEEIMEATVKVILPDANTTCIKIQPGRMLQTVIEDVCNSKNIAFNSIEVLQLGCDKPMDLNVDVATMSGKEIVIEKRVLFRMNLPNKKFLGVKAKPTRSINKVFEPILLKYGLNLDDVVLHLAGSSSPLDPEVSVSTIENKQVMVQSREDYAGYWWLEWGGFDMMSSTPQSKAPSAGGNLQQHSQQQQQTPKPNDSLEAITNKVFEDLFDANGASVFDELGVLDLESKVEDKSRLSVNTKSVGGIFPFSKRRNSIDKSAAAVPKNRRRSSLSLSQKNLASRLAALKIKDPDEEKFFELLSKVQSQRLDDQRGLSDAFELPEFLKDETLLRNTQRSTSANDLSDGLLSVSNLNKSYSQPEGLDVATPRPRERLSPTPQNLSQFNDSFNNDFIVPSHNEAESLFTAQNSQTSSPNFQDPTLTKKSIRDIGFDYSFDGNESVSSQQDERLRARVTLNSPFNEIDRTVIERGSSFGSQRSSGQFDLDRTLTDSTTESGRMNITVPIGSSSLILPRPNVYPRTRVATDSRRPVSCPPPGHTLINGPVSAKKPPPVPEKPAQRTLTKASSCASVSGKPQSLQSTHLSLSLNEYSSRPSSCIDLPSPSTHDLIAPSVDDDSIVNSSFNSLCQQEDVKVTFV
ncbi:regulator of G-protein signaling 12-like [Tubulanus polymorphus]|uniref:regulator of G-protein signaling 12-like n=1 Tax=Tubulanus polymorphus TaxID=672921 RepID=UPI003DA53515